MSVVFWLAICKLSSSGASSIEPVEIISLDLGDDNEPKETGNITKVPATSQRVGNIIER